MSRSTDDESSLKVLVPGNKTPSERENGVTSLLDKKLKSLSKTSSSANPYNNRLVTEREHKTKTKNKCRTHHPVTEEGAKPRHKSSSLKYQESTNDKISTIPGRVGKTMQNHETSHGKKSLQYQIRLHNRSASNDSSGQHKGYNSKLVNQKFKNATLKDISRAVAFGDRKEVFNKKTISEELSRMQDRQIVPILKKIQKFSKVKNQISGHACVEREYRASSEGLQDPVFLKMGKRPLVPVASTTRMRVERRLVNTSSRAVQHYASTL